VGQRKNIHNELVLRAALEGALTPTFVLFMATSGMLAASAFLTNSVPVLIAAMIVAPVFSPLMLLCYGLVGGQPRLALRGLGTALLGIAIAVALAMLTTWVLNVTGAIPKTSNLLHHPLLEERVRPGWYSAITAIGAGLVGPVALAKRKMDVLVGTVAAVALVPAACAAGIAWMSDDPLRALGGLSLLVLNLGFIVGVGLLTLLVAGTRLEPKD